MTPSLPPREPPGVPELPYDTAQTLATVISTLDECGATVDHYTGKLTEIVDECLRSCGGTWALCQACVEGKINDRFAIADAVLGKCVTKLNDRAAMLFAQAAHLAAPVIAQVPELTDIVAANTLAQRLPVAPGPTIFPPADIAPLPPQIVPYTMPLAVDGGIPKAGDGMCAGLRFGLCCHNGQWWLVVNDVLKGVVLNASCDGFQGPPQNVIDWVTAAAASGQGDYVGVSRDCKTGIDTFPCPPEVNPAPPPTTPPTITPPTLPPTPPSPGPPKPTPPETCDTQPVKCPPKPAPTILDTFGLGGWNQLTCPTISQDLPQWTVDSFIAGWGDWIAGKATWLAKVLDQPIRAFSTKQADQFDAVFAGMVANIFVEPFKPMVQWLFSVRDCDFVSAFPPWGIRAVLGFIEAYTHVGFGELIENLSYSIHRQCPTLLPDQAGIDRAFLGDRIDFFTWKCWTRAVNNLDTPAFAALQASRVQPNHEQWIAAYMRGLIGDKGLADALRGVGVIDPAEAGILQKLMQQLPGPGDIVRFMVRNTEDPNIVAPPPLGFGLDAEFDAKFQGPLKTWAKGQGLGDDVMLRFWRAHWQIPSPQQLYVMLQRLRADNAPGLEVTIKDVLRALGENDVLPFWRERLIAVAYKLPRVSNAFKLFDQGIWNVEKLFDYYQSYGYDRPTAQNMVQLAQRQSLDAAEKAARLVSKQTVAKAYQEGSIGDAEAVEGFALAGLNEIETGLAMRQVQYLKGISLRRSIMKAIKCRFDMCEFGKDVAITLLVENGWQTQDAIANVTCWKQKCDVKLKEATLAQLCKWFGEGFLSETEYRVRLARLGYSRVDIARIMQTCADDLAKKSAKPPKKGK